MHVAGGGFFDSAVGSHFASRSETRPETPKKAAPKKAAPAASASGMPLAVSLALDERRAFVDLKGSCFDSAQHITQLVWECSKANQIALYHACVSYFTDHLFRFLLFHDATHMQQCTPKLQSKC